MKALLKDKDEEKKFEVIKLDGNPFSTVKVDETYKVLIGNRIATEKEFNSIEEVYNFVNSKDWDLIMSLIISVINYLKEAEQHENS